MATDADRRDVRRAKVIMLLDDLLERGVVPGAIEVDGMRIEVLSVPAPKDQPASALSDVAEEPASVHPGSYRQRAREELRRARAGRDLA